MNWNLDIGSLQLTNLSHVGIAVKDAEKTAIMLSKIWNIGTPEVFDYSPKKSEMFYGEAFKVRLVFIKFGAFPVELLQPLDNKSIWSKFIAEEGEGIHHVALGVSNYDEHMAKMKKMKHKLLVAAEFNGEKWCYFDCNPGGVVFEFREEYKKKA